jgi:hypothetical protein
MASTKIPAPPRWLTLLYLVLAGPLSLLLAALAVIGASRGYDFTAVRCLVLAGLTAGGIPSARKWRRIGRR